MSEEPTEQDIADAKHQIEAARADAVNRVLWELAGRALQAYKLTEDPRLGKVAAVAAEQIKETSSFDDLLVAYSEQVSSSPSNNFAAAATSGDFAGQQTAAMYSSQQDEWTRILEQQRQQNATINADIAKLAKKATDTLKARENKSDG